MFCPQQNRLYANKHHGLEAKTEPVIARDDWAQQNMLHTCMNTQGVLGSHVVWGDSPMFSRSSADCHPSVLTYSIRCSDCTKTDLERFVFPKWMSRIIARMREELHANWWVPHVRIYNVFFLFFSEATAVVLYGVQRKLCALAALTHSGCNWVWQVDICWQRRETGA